MHAAHSDPAPPEERELVTLDHDGSTVAVTMLDGRLHAFDDTCPHAGCSLGDGELEGQTVVCPCHLARFDVTTGAVVDGPAPSGVRIWSATVSDGVLEVRRDEDAGAEDVGADDVRADDVRADDARADDLRSEPPEDASDDGTPDTSARGAPASSGPDMDVTVLIEREHEALRRQFQAIEATSATGDLDTAWTALADLLEIHASGEEALLYPKLARAAEDGVEEAVHAVRDHNEIRSSVHAVREHRAGSDGWWQAFRAAREVNEEHLQEEERDALPSFRENTDEDRRRRLGAEWIAFHEQHQQARGLSGNPVDPGSVVDTSGGAAP